MSSLPETIGPFTIKLADEIIVGGEKQQGEGDDQGGGGTPVTQITFTWTEVASRSYLFEVPAEQINITHYEATTDPPLGKTYDFALAANALSTQSRVTDAVAQIAKAYSEYICTGLVYTGGEPEGISLPLNKAIIDDGKGTLRPYGLGALCRFMDAGEYDDYDLYIPWYFGGRTP